MEMILDYPGSPNAVTNGRRRFGHQRRPGAPGFKAGRSVQEPRNAILEAEKMRRGFSPKASRGAWPANILISA